MNHPTCLNQFPILANFFTHATQVFSQPSMYVGTIMLV